MTSAGISTNPDRKKIKYVLPLKSGMLRERPKYRVPRANQARLTLIVVLRIIGVRNRSRKLALLVTSSLMSGMTSSLLIPLNFMMFLRASLHSSTLPVASNHLGDSGMKRRKGAKGRIPQATTI